MQTLLLNYTQNLLYNYKPTTYFLIICETYFLTKYEKHFLTLSKTYLLTKYETYLLPSSKIYLSKSTSNNIQTPTFNRGSGNPLVTCLIKSITEAYGRGVISAPTSLQPRVFTIPVTITFPMNPLTYVINNITKFHEN